MTKKTKALHLQKETSSVKVWGDRKHGLRAWVSDVIRDIFFPTSCSVSADLSLSLLNATFCPIIQPTQPEQNASTKWLYDHLNTFHDSKKEINLPNLVKHFNCDDGLDFLAVSNQVSLPFDQAEFLLRMAKTNLEMNDYWGAKILILAAYLLYQSKIVSTKDIVALVKDKAEEDQLLEQLPWCYKAIQATSSPEEIKIHLNQLDLEELSAEVSNEEPMITLNVTKEGTAEKKLQINSLVNLNTALKLSLGKHEKNIRLKHNGERVFLSSSGKKTLRQLGFGDEDVLEVEDSILQPAVIVPNNENISIKSNRTKKTKKKSMKKKKKSY